MSDFEYEKLKAILKTYDSTSHYQIVTAETSLEQCNFCMIN